MLLDASVPAAITCGSGTILRQARCVPAEIPAPDAATSSDASVLDTLPPVFAGVTAAAPSSDSSIRLSWDAASDDRTLSSDIVYEIYWTKTSGGEDFSTPALVSGPGATSAVVGGLEKWPAKYFFVVRARDLASNDDANVHEVDGSAGYDEAPPVFAGCDAAVAVNDTDIRVSWNAATSMTPDLLPTYSVWVAETAADARAHTGPPSVVVTGMETTFQLGRGHHYYFSCVATDGRGKSDGNTATKDVLFDSPPSFEPTCPQVYPLFETSRTVKIGWCAATDDVTPASDLVYLVRITVDGTERTVTSAPGATDVTIDGLSPWTSYFVNVQARDSAGQLDGNQSERGVYTRPTFSETIQPILTASCAAGSCHDVGTAAGGLVLAEGQAYAELVGVLAKEGPDIGEPLLMRVAPGDIFNSYLARKLFSYFGPIAGVKMPPPGDGGVSLAVDASAISAWISYGAIND